MSEERLRKWDWSVVQKVKLLVWWPRVYARVRVRTSVNAGSGFIYRSWSGPSEGSLGGESRIGIALRIVIVKEDSSAKEPSINTELVRGGESGLQSDCLGTIAGLSYRLSRRRSRREILLYGNRDTEWIQWWKHYDIRAYYFHRCWLSSAYQGNYVCFRLSTNTLWWTSLNSLWS